ncbi:LamG-like jellyroll fold domain-containing protein [Catenuloplanes japonicus]|uniref:LamG-like jellyroll fold domain-containing protein n=1 Tax=Catenuloplanes japonicus TaxID=33876 RepID=UPI0006914787|nr:LamG-like jellyroll fold domain-containing protein [Catenuloplanes japonicus]
MSQRLPRRALLQTAVAAPAAGLLVGSTFEAAPAWANSGKFDVDDPRFSIAVLPDTQYLFDEDSSDPEPLRATFRYLRESSNIAFMTHLGDVTEHGSDHEIELASKTFKDLDGKFPYSVLAGNHDINGSTTDQRGTSAYLKAFNPKRFAASRTFGGASPDGYNSYHVIKAGGRQWLVLALDWRLSDAGFAWAQSVLDRHKTLPAIITTHELAYADDNGTAYLSGYGQQIWDRLIRKNDQIFLSLNGHYWPPGRTVLTNDAGHDVHVHITNYQDRYYGGAGMIRDYAFDVARGVIDVSTYSPWFLAKDPAKRTALEEETIELTGPVDRFSLEIDFDARFAGFSGVVPPAPRPASAVLLRDTVAYWRFDGLGLADGATVANGTVVRDLAKRGNDLTVQSIGAGAPLLASADHHPGAPAHASLRFNGGKSPDRGSILATSAHASLNSLTFESGYTIEAFIKLPAPFEGDHSWMGILSWQGRSGDAGKTSGWSQDEPTCSVNLSGERFLQYVVYPNDRDADPTSWSHALPMGRWMHIAIVNDSRRTTIYIDGSKIARNPTQASKGITTMGKPFTIGATQFAEKFGQGFYGWIGDVRITARALPARDFLTTTH